MCSLVLASSSWIAISEEAHEYIKINVKYVLVLMWFVFPHDAVILECALRKPFEE